MHQAGRPNSADKTARACGRRYADLYGSRVRFGGPAEFTLGVANAVRSNLAALGRLK